MSLPQGMRAWLLAAVLLLCALEGSQGLVRKTSQARAARTRPSLFVAVFSFQGNQERREAWRKGFGAQGLRSKSRRVQFVVCSPFVQGRTEQGLRRSLMEEELANSDMLFVPCKEGIARGAITEKLSFAMQEFVRMDNYSMFMKVEDDTFVPLNRVQKFLASQLESTETALMGISMPAGRPVNRDASSSWYQPEDVYPNSTYPMYMQRAGYIMGGTLVKAVVDGGIAETNMLSNEDQAAGVWTAIAASRGVPVRYVELPGRDGYDVNDANMRSWGQYSYLLHHGLKSHAMKCLARKDQKGEDVDISCCFAESMFVAIFSARAYTERRIHAREMLKNTKSGGGRIVAKFAVCDASDDHVAALVEENKTYGDIEILPCTEGATRTLLTKKLVASMQAYLANYSRLTYFMKVDDDTFVSFSKLRRALALQGTSDYLYMGIRGPKNKPVNRNVNSFWYQPYNTYESETYPDYMEGGTGYVLGKALVQKLNSSNVMTSKLLSNEDQALGVWVHMLQRENPIAYVDLVGTNGKQPADDVCFGEWQNYPYVMHHYISGESISCLARVDAADDAKRKIDVCFPGCANTTTDSLKQNMQVMKTEVSYVEVNLNKLKAMVARSVRSAEFLRGSGHESALMSATRGSEVRSMLHHLLEELQDANAGIGRVGRAASGVYESHEEAAANDSATASLLQLDSNSEGSKGRKVKKGSEGQKTISFEHSDGSMVTNITFLHIPKNAGTAIEDAGAKAHVWWPRKWLSMWHGIDMPDNSSCEKYHVPPHYLAQINDEDAFVYDGNGTFCATRHPYERLVSEYLYMLAVPWGTGMSNLYDTDLNGKQRCTEEGLNHFLMKALTQVKAGRRYIHDCHFVPQAEYIWGPDGYQWCQNILSVDNLPKQFNALMEKAGSTARMNTTAEKTNNSTKACKGITTSSLNSSVISLINEIYTDDFEKLHYEYKSSMPHWYVGLSHAAFAEPRPAK